MPKTFTLCDDKVPPWINKKTKSCIYRKHSLYQRQRKPGSSEYTCLNALTLDIPNARSFSKLKHHECLANKLNDSKTAPKTHWNILKIFVNSSTIPLIPPLLVDNKLVTHFFLTR